MWQDWETAKSKQQEEKLRFFDEIKIPAIEVVSR